jgi:glutamate synthase (NADPH/NADH) small chain
VDGRELKNVHYAMEYLTQQNRINAGAHVPGDQRISAKGKTVVVIGGGDTGSDCIGTAHRQGAKEIFQFEIMPQPPERGGQNEPWPVWPKVMRTSTSQEEGCHRKWCVLTKKLTGQGEIITALEGCEVEWTADDDGRMQMKEVPGSEFSMGCDLVLLAMGFVHVVHEGLVSELGVDLDARGNIVRDEDYMTTEPGVFVAGDAGRGASLVVWAINEGREAAESIDRWLTKHGKYK